MNLRKIRKKFGLSQLGLAKLSGLGRYAIYLIENGYKEIDETTIEKLDKAISKIKRKEYVKHNKI